MNKSKTDNLSQSTKTIILSVTVIALSLIILSDPQLVTQTLSADNINDKVALCHFSGPREDTWVALQVGSPAADSHTKHGDFPYRGSFNTDGQLPKTVSDQWCYQNQPVVPTQPPAPTPDIGLVSSCQSGPDQGLVLISNNTVDSVTVKISQDSQVEPVFTTLPPMVDNQPGLAFMTLPVGRQITADAYTLTMDGLNLVYTSNPYQIPATSPCTTITYCFQGSNITVFDNGTLRSPSLGAGSVEGACL